MKVTEWVRSERSPDLNQYQVTNTWYPNRWEFSFGQDLPEEAREFYMEPIVGTGQMGFSSDGTEYSEGATFVKDKEGRLIGRGFAESPWYADTVRTCLVLAGLPGTPEMINLVRRQPPSWALKIWSMIYVNWPPNKTKMNRLLKDCIENGINL